MLTEFTKTIRTSIGNLLLKRYFNYINNDLKIEIDLTNIEAKNVELIVSDINHKKIVYRRSKLK